MKALLEKHLLAIKLRKLGWSYSAIKNELGIAKSTANAWLNSYPLSYKQLVYKDMNIETEIKYWSGITKVDSGNFTKPYIKATTLKGLTYRNSGHGTCNVIARGLKFARPVFAGMEFLSRMY